MPDPNKYYFHFQSDRLDALEVPSCVAEYGLKPSFVKPSVPDDDGLHFLTGVETPAYDKPSVPDETPVATNSRIT